MLQNKMENFMRMQNGVVNDYFRIFILRSLIDKGICIFITTYINIQFKQVKYKNPYLEVER